MRTVFPRQSLAHLQTLEPRRLLSVTVSLDADAGLLHVMGDQSNDQIKVTLQNGVDGPPPVRGMMVSVRDHDKEIYSGFFLEGQLTEVRVDGGHGDDDIMVANDDCPVNTLIMGDYGNDTIDAFISDRATPSQIYAGEGDDMVTLRTGQRALEGYVVLGEGGNDTITGSELSDTLYGDNESTSPVSMPGDDVIHGGGGNDALYGGQGNDALFGDNGDDYLNGNEGSDIIDGGAGNDAAAVDQFDKFTDIESFTP
jgi:Ca2+-binding RTX toxin-like protein